MELLPILVIAVALVLVIGMVVRRKKAAKQDPAPSEEPVPMPIVVDSVGDIYQNLPPAPRAVVIYEDMIRDVRICPHCDGENDRRAVRCRVCGDRL